MECSLLPKGSSARWKNVRDFPVQLFGRFLLEFSCKSGWEERENFILVLLSILFHLLSHIFPPAWCEGKVVSPDAWQKQEVDDVVVNMEVKFACSRWEEAARIQRSLFGQGGRSMSSNVVVQRFAFDFVAVAD
eukprot:2650143-Rhodomonas_salina.1